MNNPITNSIFDTRDLIEYKEYLESELIDNYNDFSKEDVVEDVEDVENWSKGFKDEYLEDIKHYKNILEFCEELESSSDFVYGEVVIHEDYFTQYTEDLVKDCGYLSDDLPSWIENNIDWDGVAAEVMQDYTEVDFEGGSYFIRS